MTTNTTCGTSNERKRGNAQRSNETHNWQQIISRKSDAIGTVEVALDGVLDQLHHARQLQKLRARSCALKHVGEAVNRVVQRHMESRIDIKMLKSEPLCEADVFV